MLCSAIANGLQIVFSNSLCENAAKWDTSQIFKEDRFLVRFLAGPSVTKTATSLGVPRAGVSKVMTTYTMGRHHHLRGIVVENRN